MNDQTQTPDEEERPFLLTVTLPGPICGCPIAVKLEGRVKRPERPDMPTELAESGISPWLFSPTQLQEFLEDLNQQVMRAYAMSLERRYEEMEKGEALACTEGHAAPTTSLLH